jgi:hypothetical protein
MNVYKPFYAPDLDTNWSRNPGALLYTSAFAPLQRGILGSVGKVSVFSAPTDTDVQHAEMFRQVDGSVRFLVFTPNDIDEYDSAGAKTNRATALTTATTWQATAWGNQIIAVSHENATLSSTGAGFSALGGGAPSAKHVASNVNFVMMGNIKDGVSDATPAEVWWCNISNPAQWTVGAVGSQAGRYMLNDAPGPVTALVAFRDTFVAFKDNAIFVGEYIGAPFFFGFRMISNRVGCVAPKSIVELDNKLYFVHGTGVWEYDGASLRNVSLQVFQTMLAEIGYVTGHTGDGSVNPPSGREGASLSLVSAAGDDQEGVLQVMLYQTVTATGVYFGIVYCYNVRTGMWSRVGAVASSASTVRPIFVEATTVDIASFLGNGNSRSLVVANAGFVSGTTMGLSFPAAGDTSFRTPTFVAGNIGNINGHATVTQSYAELMAGSTSEPFASVTLQAYKEAPRHTAVGSAVAAAYNSDTDTWNGRLSARFGVVTFAGANGKKILLSGMGVGEIGR